MLTGFPFGESDLGFPLGPTHPCLTTSGKEPLPYRRSGFPPLFAATTAGIYSPASVQHRTSRPAFDPSRTPPYRITPRWAWRRVSAPGLSPVHFPCPETHPVSCYALLRE